VWNQQNAQFANSLLGEREINDASAVVQYLIDSLGGNFLRRNAKKTIAVGGLLVDEYNRPTLAKLLKSFINTGDGHGAN
jgi:hypothetical protein